MGSCASRERGTRKEANPKRHASPGKRAGAIYVLMETRNAYPAAVVRALEEAVMTTEGISGNALMERAGAAAFEHGRRRFAHARRWLVLAGSGNNAGDGFVIARLAKEHGLDVETLLLSPANRPRGDAATQFEAMTAAGVPVAAYGGGGLPQCDLIVDAMLGIGLDRPLKGRYLEAVRAVNESGIPALSVDIPTGIHADSGRRMGAAVRAALTVTFIAEKSGLFLGEAPDHVGQRVMEPLGRIPPQPHRKVEDAADGRQQGLRIFAEQDWRAMLAVRHRTDHKGRFGHVLVVGGGPGMGGAARLAGEGALRAGAGLVSVAAHPEHAAELIRKRPELMVRAVRGGSDLASLLERATVVAVGCGLGQDAWARELFAAVRESSLPCIIDADGLNLLAQSPARGEPRSNAPPLVITPHPGEAGRLLGLSSGQVQADRLQALSELRQRIAGVVLLKGAHTLVSAGQRPPWVIDAGNPGMATAGMGDVLTGLLAGLWAQFADAIPENVAALAAYAHARAGDIAASAGQRGMIASDLVAALRQVVNPEALERDQ